MSNGVNLLQKGDEARWDEFVKSHPESNFVHLTCYKKILEETYGYEGEYLYIDGAGEILSLLPSFRFKKKFISQPFSKEGGILFKTGLGEDEKESILQIWKEYFKKNSASLEIHGQSDAVDLFKSHFIAEPAGNVAVLGLGPYEGIYNKFDYQIKKALKKAEREGVKVFEETNDKSIKEKFYPLYARYSKERHGSPPHKLDLFLNYYKYSPQNIRIYFAEFNKVLVAALLGFLFRDRVDLALNPSLEKYFIYRPDDLLHARFIRWACENNFRYFDFGPVNYQGQIRYKKKWGSEFFHHFNFYIPSSSGEPVSREFRRSDIKVRLFSWAWKNFMPLCLANKLGPLIRKRLIK